MVLQTNFIMNGLAVFDLLKSHFQVFYGGLHFISNLFLPFGL